MKLVKISICTTIYVKVHKVLRLLLLQYVISPSSSSGEILLLSTVFFLCFKRVFMLSQIFSMLLEDMMVHQGSV